MEGADETSHMMKNSRRGRPFLKDTFDLFATLIVSLPLTTHKQFFRSFTNSFTTDEAASHLASLKFSQSNRGPDPRNPTRIITTTTTTTFSMTRDMAKHIAQHFMDSRLIENAADKSNNTFKDRGIFQITPKGLHVLERFIAKNGMTVENLVNAFSTQPICAKLLHLERRSADDDIIVSEEVLHTLFRRFAGRAPNYIVNTADSPLDATQEYHERANGVPLMDIQERSPQMIGRGALQTYRNTFTALVAMEWLCDYTTIMGRDEAAEMCAHFMRYKWIALVSDKRKNTDEAVIFTEADFRCTPKAVYQFTDEGKRAARWPQSVINGAPMPQAARDPAQAALAKKEAAALLAAETSTRGSSEDSPGPSNPPNPSSGGPSSDRKSNTDRLKSILDEPALRHLFREFLRGNFCEENLSFWLDVQDFKRRFHTSSSAIATNIPALPALPNSSSQRPGTANAALHSHGKSQTPGQLAMEKHHQALVGMTFVIYNTYLAQGSACELNIDHGLRNELFQYLSDVLAQHAAQRAAALAGSASPAAPTPGSSGQMMRGRVEPEQANMFNATQLQHIIRIYERIQVHVFRLMASDSVPKFIKTQRFLALRSWVDDVDALDSEELQNYGPAHAPKEPPGLGQEEEVGRAYLTVSQAASDKRQTKLKNAKLMAAGANASESSLAGSR
ncbi:regulator of G protein signaling superfamily [Clavulina sp. PMI_390]|nr:regulator of G protein signaling superfamily [Clavulina sp. PMI_390]